MNKQDPILDITLKDANNNIITPVNDIYTVVFNKNKLPRVDKLNLFVISSNTFVDISYNCSNNGIAQINSNGEIRMRNNGDVIITISQPSISLFNSFQKTIKIKLVISKTIGRKPLFLLNF